jgi:hypothetical protein
LPAVFDGQVEVRNRVASFDGFGDEFADIRFTCGCEFGAQDVEVGRFVEYVVERKGCVGFKVVGRVTFVVASNVVDEAESDFERGIGLECSEKARKADLLEYC